MDAKHQPDYKYCILCADGTPKVNHNISDCISEYDPWYEIPYESFLEATQKKKTTKTIGTGKTRFCTNRSKAVCSSFKATKAYLKVLTRTERSGRLHVRFGTKETTPTSLLLLSP
jgi:hypothetical protein